MNFVIIISSRKNSNKRQVSRGLHRSSEIGAGEGVSLYEIHNYSKEVRIITNLIVVRATSEDMGKEAQHIVILVCKSNFNNFLIQIVPKQACKGP
jgi:hypothetical protein